MANVEVYNPKAVPVVYGDGRTIGGLEWAVVDEDLISEFLADKRLIVAKPRPHMPQEEIVVEIVQESSIDDSSLGETDVSSDTASQQDVAEDSEQDAPSDAPLVTEEPATIRKSRRRKRTTTERE